MGRAAGGAATVAHVALNALSCRERAAPAVGEPLKEPAVANGAARHGGGGDVVRRRKLGDFLDEDFALHVTIRDNCPANVKGQLSPLAMRDNSLSCRAMKTFRQALLDAIKDGISLTDVAAGAGVSYEQLKKLRQREDARTNVHDAIRVARYFGMTLNEFMADDLQQDRLDLVRTYNSLSPEERDLVRALASARRAPPHAD